MQNEGERWRKGLTRQGETPSSPGFFRRELSHGSTESRPTDWAVLKSHPNHRPRGISAAFCRKPLRRFQTLERTWSSPDFFWRELSHGSTESRPTDWAVLKSHPNHRPRGISAAFCRKRFQTLERPWSSRDFFRRELSHGSTESRPTVEEVVPPSGIGAMA